MRSEKSQFILILSGVLVTMLFGIFLYREIFPEYKIYQENYVALEEFRSSYTHQPAPSFQIGIKQIVIEREDKGPPIIDRCTSCHVALQVPYFSPTKIAHDLNGNIVRDDQGRPLQVPNEEYIWEKLEEKIGELRDPAVLAQVKKEGSDVEIKDRLEQAKRYEALKTTKIGDHVYDVTKALQMHPLIGNETRPFEYHSIDEVGCTSCHNGNGRGLTTENAHGPVFDGEYAIEFEGPIPQFTEGDKENDPKFAKVFNNKPGHELLFQTTPIFVGALIQAKCMLCHQTSNSLLQEDEHSVLDLKLGREKKVKLLLDAYQNEKQALIDLLEINQSIKANGYEKTITNLKLQQSNYALPQEQLSHIFSQLSYLEHAGKEKSSKNINNDLMQLLGSKQLALSIEKVYKEKGKEGIEFFLKEHLNDPQSKGTLFIKAKRLNYDQDLLQHAEDVNTSFTYSLHDPKNISALTSDVNELTQNFQRGRQLFIEQACYACHRIATFSRGGVGPELTNAGYDYPWFLKQSIVWPQADLSTSTMPNMRMDHLELQDLMTFLLAQKGSNKAVAQTAYKADLTAWEAGRKQPWEEHLPPAEMEDLRNSMTIFATQGCAACHRLQGFDSNVGFRIEKEKSSFDKLYAEQMWFKKLFPEVIHISQYDQELPGSEIVAQIEKNAKEIDEKIASDVRTNGLLEEIDKNYPETIESYYSPFRFASRAKNHYYEELAMHEKDPEKLAAIQTEHAAWQKRVHCVLMMYIQTYGLGRLIGPHLNWSGIYRTDEWLMEHFHNPAAHVPRSLMPIMPFDDTKFYALTNMLDRLAVKNRNATRAIWENKGFNASEAFDIHCVQCHGADRQGNGAIAEWIYPIPKNLHNADFLRNLTKDEAIISITHGVKGTPMPPWGEVADDKPAAVKKIAGHMPVLTASEIGLLVDWLYSNLPGNDVFKETGVPKWEYSPKDVLKELYHEGNELQPGPVDIPKVESKIRSEVQPQVNNPPIQESLVPEKNTEEGGKPDQRSEPQKAHPVGNKQIAIAEALLSSNKDDLSQDPAMKIEDVFDVVPIKTGPEKESYYIKKKYYTPQNIQAGQQFFLDNCAVCHGNEANGSSIRAEAMQEAKPRMLTNLDWIRSRDDLRLLRSIKYGVQGTAMTPWGDFTSSLQRLQLVIFIRTLSEEKDLRDLLAQSLYRAFDIPLMKLEEARVKLSQQMVKLDKERDNLNDNLKETEQLILHGKALSSDAVKIYQQKLAMEKKQTELKHQDDLLLQIKSEITKQDERFNSLGAALINKKMTEETMMIFYQMIDQNDQLYSFDQGKLAIKNRLGMKEHFRSQRQMIEKELDLKIEVLQNETEPNPEKEKEKQANIEGIKKLKAKLITATEEALRSYDRQVQLVNEVYRK